MEQSPAAQRAPPPGLHRPLVATGLAWLATGQGDRQSRAVPCQPRSHGTVPCSHPGETGLSPLQGHCTVTPSTWLLLGNLATKPLLPTAQHMLSPEITKP